MTPPPKKRVRAAENEAAGGVRGRLTGLFSRAANRTGEGAERLREAAREMRRPPLLQQALAAQERGNSEAAFWLLEEEYAEHSAHPEVAVAFWNVAGELDRAAAASSAAVWLIEHHAAAGEIELAAQYFAELTRSVPTALVTPPAVVRMLPALRERVNRADEETQPDARALLCSALQQALDERNETPSPGLAFRLFKEAREIEPAAARKAAQLALASPDLHETKQELLQRWLDGETESLEGETESPASETESLGEVVAQDADEKPASPAGAGPAAPVLEPPSPAVLSQAPEAELEPAPRIEPDFSAHPDSNDSLQLLDPDALMSSDEPPLDPLSDAQITAATDRLPPPGPETPAEELVALIDLDLLPAMPTRLGEDALELLLPGGRESRVGWREIQALAVAEVAGLGPEPVTVIDCVLNWRQRSKETLRVVRLRLDRFEPKCLVEDAGEDPLETFLAELLERTHAVPLPDPESALGLRRASFDSLEAYERAVLGAA